jgi:AcrR family transcriptional regulator
MGRRPGESGAREDILRAARELFAERGFDRATIRSIAARAEVDPALVHHYFGTKDDLLVAALELPMDPDAIFAGLDPEAGPVGAAIVRRALALWDEPTTRRPLLALMRTGISHERAAAALRDLMSRTLLTSIASLAVRDDAALRAALVGAQMGGLLMARYVLGIGPLAELSGEQVAALVGPVVDLYLCGELAGR